MCHLSSAVLVIIGPVAPAYAAESPVFEVSPAKMVKIPLPLTKHNRVTVRVRSLCWQPYAVLHHIIHGDLVFSPPRQLGLACRVTKCCDADDGSAYGDAPAAGIIG